MNEVNGVNDFASIVVTIVYVVCEIINPVPVVVNVLIVTTNSQVANETMEHRFLHFFKPTSGFIVFKMFHILRDCLYRFLGNSFCFLKKDFNLIK